MWYLADIRASFGWRNDFNFKLRTTSELSQLNSARLMVVMQPSSVASLFWTDLHFVCMALDSLVLMVPMEVKKSGNWTCTNKWVDSDAISWVSLSQEFLMVKLFHAPWELQSYICHWVLWQMVKSELVQLVSEHENAITDLHNTNSKLHYAEQVCKNLKWLKEIVTF